VTVADDYFARVRPLLGAGLSEHAVAVDDAEVALLVLELLAGCMLQDVTVTRPETRAALERHLTWKQPFLPLWATGRADARISARRSADGARVSWSAGREVSIAVDPSDTLSWMDVSYHVARTLRDALLYGAPWPEGTR
jgi:hypothetical protein